MITLLEQGNELLERMIAEDYRIFRSSVAPCLSIAAVGMLSGALAGARQAAAGRTVIAVMLVAAALLAYLECSWRKYEDCPD
jgi:hypothetical protein